MGSSDWKRKNHRRKICQRNCGQRSWEEGTAAGRTVERVDIGSGYVLTLLNVVLRRADITLLAFSCWLLPNIEYIGVLSSGCLLPYIASGVWLMVLSPKGRGHRLALAFKFFSYFVYEFISCHGGMTDRVV